MTTVATGVGPFTRLDGPLPLPRRSNLLAVAQEVPLDQLADRHWLAGVWVNSYPADPVGTNDPCSTGSDKIKDPGGLVSQPIFLPFTAYIAETCAAVTVGADPLSWFVPRLLPPFKAGEAAAAEAVLATGNGLPSWTVATVPPGPEPVPHLTDAHLDELNGGAAASPIHALELLEDAIGATGRGGIIHATPATVTAWMAVGGGLLVWDPAGVLRTVANWTPVVSGDGYLGAHPDGGTAPGARQAWAFATGNVRYLADPPLSEDPLVVPTQYRQAIDTSSNVVTYRAERNYVVFYDSDTNDGAPYPPLQAGVLVDLSLSTP